MYKTEKRMYCDTNELFNSKLLDDKYLDLPRIGIDTNEAPQLVIVAPTESGKTALVKSEYVIYIEFKIFEDLKAAILGSLQAIYDQHLVLNELKAVTVIHNVLRKLLICASCLVKNKIVTTPEEFLRFWSRDPATLVKILFCEWPDIEMAPSFRNFIFAFDECQELLSGLPMTVKMHSRGKASLFNFLVKACSSESGNRRVFSGTSMKLTDIKAHVSPSRKKLFQILSPPMFDNKSIVKAYLKLNKVEEDIATLASEKLVGIPLSSRIFVDVYSSDWQHQFTGIHNIRDDVIVGLLLQQVQQSLVDIFRIHMPNGSKEYFDNTVHIGDLKVSRREILVRFLMQDMCLANINRESEKEESTTSLKVLNQVETVFMPIIKTNTKYVYRTYDNLALHALIDILTQDEDSCEKLYALIHADKLLQLRIERKPVSGIVGEFIMEQLFLALNGNLLSDCSLFHALAKPEYTGCMVQISRVDRTGFGYKEVLQNIDFNTICVAIDPMARFDFMCLLENSTENTVVAVFGGAKLFSSNISADIFCDNVLSCDPANAFWSVKKDEPTNMEKYTEFQEIWKTFHETIKGQNRKLKVLMLAFAYPHPVGTIEYPTLYEFESDKLVYCFGSEKIQDISKKLPFVCSLIDACAGQPSKRSKRKKMKTFEDALIEVQKKKPKK